MVCLLAGTLLICHFSNLLFAVMIKNNYFCGVFFIIEYYFIMWD